MCEFEGCSQIGPERWAPVVGLEGFYEVSDRGRVRRLPTEFTDTRGRKCRRKGGLKTASVVRNNGYLKVSMSSPGEINRNVAVHSLVLSAFVGPRPEDEETRHLDGRKHHNCLSNLAWGTPSANMADQKRHGTHRQTSKTHCPRSHPLAAPNLVTSPSFVAKQIRSCLACARAKSLIKNRVLRGHPAQDLQVLSDAYYAEIVAAALECAA